MICDLLLHILGRKDFPALPEDRPFQPIRCFLVNMETHFLWDGNASSCHLTKEDMVTLEKFRWIKEACPPDTWNMRE